MPGMLFDRSANVIGNLFTSRSLTKKLDVLFPGQCHQNTHPCGSAAIEEPAGWRMINSNYIHSRLAHQRQIGVYLLRLPKSARGVRFERTVRNTLDEEFCISVEKELRPGANSRVCVLCHV